MLKLIKKRLKNQKGLTLVEVLAVVVILAIVAMIAIPAIGNIIENNRIKAIKADAINVISAANIYYTDGNTDDFDGSTYKGYVDNLGSISDEELIVTRDGRISATAVKGNVVIEFDGATVADINAESPTKHATNVYVNEKPGTETPQHPSTDSGSGTTSVD